MTIDTSPILFSHLPLNEAVVAIGGSYYLTHEMRLSLAGREFLYYKGAALFDTTCCGAGGCAYAYVPGFIVAWKSKTNEEGVVQSLILPVREEADRKTITRLILEREVLFQVHFL